MSFQIEIPYLFKYNTMTSISRENHNIADLKIKNQAEDLVNNNQVSDIDQKLAEISLNKATEYIFDSSIFKSIKPENFLEKYNKFELVHDINADMFYFNIGDGLIMRPLKRDDYDRNYMGLLAQLTKTGSVDKIKFEKRFDQMRSCKGTYYTCVIVDQVKDRIAGSITHVYEQKFFRDTGARGRIEDVVVDEEYRGKKLSKMLLDVATQMSKELGCYKLSLECFDDLKKLYGQYGLELEDKQNYLCRRF